MEGVTWWVIQWQGRGSGSLEGSDSGGSLLGGRCLASHPLVLPCLASPHFRAPTVPPTPIPLTRVGAGDLGVALVGCPVPLPCPMLHHPVPKMSLWCSPGSPSQVIDTNTEPDLGTSLSLSLHPPVPLCRCPPPAGCSLCRISVCPRRVLQRWRGRGRGWLCPGGRNPGSRKHGCREPGRCWGTQAFPGVHLPLLGALPQLAGAPCPGWCMAGRGYNRGAAGAAAGREEQAADSREAEAEAGRNGSLQIPPLPAASALADSLPGN